MSDVVVLVGRDAKKRLWILGTLGAALLTRQSVVPEKTSSVPHRVARRGESNELELEGGDCQWML